MKALERPATAADELPEGVKLSEVEPNKTLLVAEANGKKYFLGQDTNRGQVCLFTVAVDGSGWNAGCAAATEGELLRTGRGPDQESAIVVSDGYDTKGLESAGWTKVHHNVLVSGG